VYELGKGNRASSSDSPVVLVHGWSGSRRYYDDAFASLQQTSNHPPLLVRYDLRGHGESEQPKWGHHVSRYAADLRDLLAHLGLDNVTLVGASLGCAIIWSYLRAFGSRKVKGACVRGPGAVAEPRGGLGVGQQGVLRRGLPDAPAGAAEVRLHGVHQRNVDGCLSNPVDPGYARLLMAETMKADPVGLATLMADHTQLDWRPALRRIDVPCLVLAGGKSQIFPLEGVKEVGRLIPGARTVVFEHEDHWLYIEDFRRFSNLVSDFAANGSLTEESVLSQAALGGRGPPDRVRAQRARVPGVEQGEPGGERDVAGERENRAE
jgi:pimeloyl-ACP methyl ester carboxylesterase